MDGGIATAGLAATLVAGTPLILLAMEDVTEGMRIKRGLRPGQDNNFSVVSQEKFLESLNSITLVFRLVMFALSSVGLMVGGVGVRPSRRQSSIRRGRSHGRDSSCRPTLSFAARDERCP